MRIIPILVFAAALSLSTGCSRSQTADPHEGHENEHTDADADHDHDHDTADHDHEHNGAADDAHGEEIILKPEMAKRLGVETRKLMPAQFYEVIRVNGRIVPSPGDVAVAVAPTSGIVTLAPSVIDGANIKSGARIASVSAAAITGGDPNAAGAQAIASAKREVDRLKPLLDEGLVTAKEYNEALTAYEAALSNYSAKAASGTVSAPISGIITNVLVNQGQYVEAGTPVAEISRTSRLALRADLPEKYYSSLNTISGANFRMQGCDDVVRLADVGGRRTSDTGMTTAQNGYLPVYFTFNNNGKVAPGSYVEVFLTGTPRNDVLMVPISALTEQQGSKYVYIKVDDEGYERRRVTTGGNDGASVEILSGLHAGDDVVVSGASAVRLAENSGAIPEGHSHNH